MIGKEIPGSLVSRWFELVDEPAIIVDGVTCRPVAIGKGMVTLQAEPGQTWIVPAHRGSKKRFEHVNRQTVIITSEITRQWKAPEI